MRIRSGRAPADAASPRRRDPGPEARRGIQGGAGRGARLPNGRCAFGLVEVGIAAAILGASLVTVLGLIQQAYRVSMRDARRDLARLLARNLAGALEAKPFARLEAEFGAGGAGRGDASVSRLLEGLIPEDGNVAGRVEIAFNRAPGDPGVGYLEVRVHDSDPAAPDTVLRRIIVDPVRAGRVEPRAGEDPDDRVGTAFHALEVSAPACADQEGQPEPWVRRNQQALAAFVEAMPSDPIAAILTRAASLDAQDGKLDRDYSRLARAPGSPRRWQRVLQGLGDAGIPDGIYEVRWDKLHVEPSPGSDLPAAADVTIHVLRAATGDEYVLVTASSLAPGGGERRLTVGSAAGTDLGRFTLSRVTIGAGPMRPRDASWVHVFSTARRIFCRYESYDTSGAIRPFHPRLLVATMPATDPPISPGKSGAHAIEHACSLAGIELESR